MRYLVLVWAVTIAACAATPHSSAKQEAVALHVGDAAAPPSLRALPELEKERSEELHRGLAQAGQVFARELPSPPTDRAYAELSAWVDQDVANWVVARRDGVEEARFQFSSSARHDPEARVIASAILGMLQEDTALQLSRIPMPAELEKEPEIARLFRELVQTQAEPFVQAARAEYKRCAGDAEEEGRPLERFERFCRSRAERLEKPAAPGPQPVAAAR